MNKNCIFQTRKEQGMPNYTIGYTLLQYCNQNQKHMSSLLQINPKGTKKTSLLARQIIKNTMVVFKKIKD